jgi:hypothetical protein
LREGQFEFRPRHCTKLRVACLVERFNRNFHTMRLNAAVFLGVAKAFDTVSGEGLICKLTVRASYLIC